MESLSNCYHERRIKADNSFSFCKHCGITIINNVQSLKSNENSYLIDQNPVTIFKKMKEISFVQGQNLSNPNYLIKRSEVLKELRIFFNKLNFRSQTFYLAIHYLDYVCLNSTETDFELMALCCLSLAGKFDENDLDGPLLSDFETAFTYNTYTIDELKKMEIFCLKILNYKLNHVTPYHILSFFTFHGYVFTDDALLYEPQDQNSKILNEKLDEIYEKVYINSKEILFHYLDNSEFINFSPIEIACSCIAISREFNQLQDSWSLHLEKIYGIYLEDLQKCISSIQVGIANKKLPNNNELSKYFSFKNSFKRSSGKRNTLSLNYEGHKIMATIEDSEALHNLEKNVIRNGPKIIQNDRNESEKETNEMKNFRARDDRKKFTVLNRGEVLLPKPTQEIKNLKENLEKKESNNKEPVIENFIGRPFSINYGNKKSQEDENEGRKEIMKFGKDIKNSNVGNNIVQKIKFNPNQGIIQIPGRKKDNFIESSEVSRKTKSKETERKGP